jgi:hypothetical protein
MSLYLNISISSMAITAPPSLATAAATILYSTIHVSVNIQENGTNASAAALYSLSAQAEDWSHFNNPYDHWHPANFESNIADSLWRTCSQTFFTSKFHWLRTASGYDLETMHTEILCNHGEISPYCAFTEETTLLPFPASEPCCSTCEFWQATFRFITGLSLLLPLILRGWWTPMDLLCKFGKIASGCYQLTFSFSTYPSVYVAFESVRATSLWGFVGSAIPSVTLGFDVTEPVNRCVLLDQRLMLSLRWYIHHFSWWTYTSLDLRNQYV